MSVDRFLFRQNDVTYRFLRLITSAEGGLTILLDRDTKTAEGNMILEEGVWKDVTDQDRDNQYKITIHPTGEIHYRSGSKSSPIKSYIEPLCKITELSRLALLSIPSLSKLNEYREGEKGVIGIKDFPKEMEGRLTFLISLVPKGKEFVDEAQVLKICSIDYEIYSVVISLCQNPPIEDGMENHFLHAGVNHGKFVRSLIGMAEAEIGFYNKVHGDGCKIFRKEDGSYLVITTVPMRKKPSLKIEFHCSGLTIEEILILKNGSEDQIKSTYKISFWIRDKGGRNKNDLSKEIKLITLDSEL